MVHKDAEAGKSNDRTDLVSSVTNALSELGPEEGRVLLQQLLRGARPGGDPFERTPPPSRRQPRRPDVVTYRVRVDLKGAKPPLWRRLEVASDLFLDDVHEIIQFAFGWTDSHLHRFGSGADPYGYDTEHYLCPFEVDEGEVGIPEEDVRLDEVLVEAGDRLFYVYDFGDDWQHVLKLEAVVTREDSAQRATCTDGRRSGPAEDCGGIPGHELIVAAIDPIRADHAEAAREFTEVFGDDVDPGQIVPTPLDIDAINDMLADYGLDAPRATADLPQPLTDLLSRVDTTPARRRLRRLIDDAALDEPMEVTVDTAAHMVRPYAWLLDRVGAEGIKLTGAGYLPPAHVEAAMTELGLADEWIGKNNRENLTLPALHLRESAQAMGLLRKYRGRLLPTQRGRSLRGAPLALWWHLAERMPLPSKDSCEAQAGLLLVIGVAARVTDGLDAEVAQLLNAIGWRISDGRPISPAAASGAAWESDMTMRRLGAFTGDGTFRRSTRATAEGVTFARAVLRTWRD